MGHLAVVPQLPSNSHMHFTNFALLGELVCAANNKGAVAITFLNNSRSQNHLPRCRDHLPKTLTALK